jgi:threonine/homoserine/homoserine lactone efflux protein
MEELPGAVLLFFITALISSYGSLQLGPVNGGVLRYCFRGEFRRAIWLAFGGSLTEIPYASVAVWGSSWLNKIRGLDLWINYGIIPLFLLLGIRYLLLAKKELTIETGLPLKLRTSPFREGIALAMFNPQLPLFWISILLWMKSGLGIYPDGLLKQAAFVLGTAAGAFYLLWLMIRISIKKRSRLSELSRRYQPDKLLGWFFILMAIVQMLRVIWGFAVNA